MSKLYFYLNVTCPIAKNVVKEYFLVVRPPGSVVEYVDRLCLNGVTLDLVAISEVELIQLLKDKFIGGLDLHFYVANDDLGSPGYVPSNQGKDILAGILSSSEVIRLRDEDLSVLYNLALGKCPMKASGLSWPPSSKLDDRALKVLRVRDKNKKRYAPVKETFYPRVHHA